MKQKDKKREIKFFENKKARFHYQILETIEAGLVLRGAQVKSLRVNQVELIDAYAFFKNGECFIMNLKIPPYQYSTTTDSHALDNQNKVLMHKKEILRLSGKQSEQHLSLIVLRIYFNAKGKVKVCLALGKGKKTRDQREEFKKRESEREIERAFKNRRKVNH